MIRSMHFATAAAVLVPFSPVAAQAVSDPAAAATVADADSGGATTDAPEPGNAAKAHEKDDQAIVVTGSRRKTADVLGGIAVLETEDMAHDLKPSLGDTLQDLPGVSSSSFGPSSSRPILRGESGDRAPVLVDGISSLDLSSSDPDHAVSINPLTAERIEVLHGPGALLYTGSAIGGVVNVTDSRIPRKAPGDVARAQRPFLSVHFACCGVYQRVYRDADGKAYRGRCPRCARAVTFAVGEGGTSARSFVVR